MNFSYALATVSVSVRRRGFFNFLGELETDRVVELEREGVGWFDMREQVLVNRDQGGFVFTGGT